LVLNDDHYDGGITEQTALTVKNATPSDMGSYKCILENDVASSASEDIVEVSVFCTYHSSHWPEPRARARYETRYNPENAAIRCGKAQTAPDDTTNPKS